jgi:chromosome segregation ATPase
MGGYSMDEGVQKFLEAEERATQLVEALQKLYEEVNSYQETSRNLQTVREELVSLIVGLKEIVIGNQEISRLLGGINAQEILEKLMNLENDLKAYSERFVALERSAAEHTEHFAALENDFKAHTEQSFLFKEDLQGLTQQLIGLDEKFQGFAQEENRKVTGIEQGILDLKDTFVTLQGLLENNLRETAEIKTDLSQEMQAVDRLNNRMVVEGRKTSETLAMLQKWVYIAVGLAGIGMVVSIIALFR